MSRPILWVDASAGVAGDMLLAALIDAGADREYVGQQVSAVIPAELSIEFEMVRRGGMRAAKVTLAPLVDDAGRRTWSSVRALLEAAPLDDAVRSAATAVFARLADAEATVHGIAAADVHFHEVGALDAIGDIVGVCAAVHDLDVAAIVVSPIALGSGTVRSQHGTLPVPVPAVLELVRGWPVVSGGAGERATPTGVALLTTLARDAGPLPSMAVDRVGVGAGTADFADRANVVRVVVGTAADDGFERDVQTVIECNVDDLDPRAWPAVIAALLDAGALDAWLTPILMKKGRPAHTLHVLAEDRTVDALRAVIVAHTSTIGARSYRVDKHALARTWRTVQLDGHDVRVKIAYAGGRIVRVSAEYEDVAAVARLLDLPVAQVIGRAEHAAAAAGLRQGAPAP